MKLIDPNQLILNAKNDSFVTMYEIIHAPGIDPIQAADICYCKECRDCIFDGVSQHYVCRRALLAGASLGGVRVEADDFCSYGERKPTDSYKKNNGV